MKNFRTLICGFFFFCTGLVYGQAKYEHFVIDTTELDYYLNWKDYQLDSLGEYDVMININKVELAQPLMDQIRRLITDRLPANISDQIDLWVAITYSPNRKYCRFFILSKCKSITLVSRIIVIGYFKVTFNPTYRLSHVGIHRKTMAGAFI